MSEALAATDIISAPTVCHRRQQTQSEVTTSADADEAASERQTYTSTSFNVLRMMPWSSDEDIEHYLTTFERIDQACKWPRQDWVLHLGSLPPHS